MATVYACNLYLRLLWSVCLCSLYQCPVSKCLHAPPPLPYVACPLQTCNTHQTSHSSQYWLFFSWQYNKSGIKNYILYISVASVRHPVKKQFWIKIRRWFLTGKLIFNFKILLIWFNFFVIFLCNSFCNNFFAEINLLCWRGKIISPN